MLTTDDYVTRGVTLGINASAISTAQLLTTDPRAAALSSLSFAYVPSNLVDMKCIWRVDGGIDSNNTNHKECARACRCIKYKHVDGSIGGQGASKSTLKRDSA
jgi:hypothetical protein